MHKILFLFLLFLVIPSYAGGNGDKKCDISLYKLKPLKNYDHEKYAPSPLERPYDGLGFIASVDGEDDYSI